MNNQRILIVVTVLIALAALGAGIGSYFALQKKQGSDAPAGLLWPNPTSFPDVTLYDQKGESFSRADLEGQWSLLFFGFTHCPDICPLTLTTLNQVTQQLETRGLESEALNVVFISVDPQRDTPGRLQQYVSYFNQDFIGVSGQPEALDKLTRTLGAVYHIGERDAEGDYMVDHSASVFLLDPDGRLVSIFTTPHDAPAMADRIMTIRTFIQQQRQG